MTACDAPIPKNIKGKIQAKKPKSDKDNAVLEEKNVLIGLTAQI